MLAPAAPDPAAVHRDAIVIDLHEDTLWAMHKHPDPFASARRRQVDLARLVAGGVDAVFFSLWVPPNADDAAALVDDLLARFRRDVLRATDRVKLARGARDVREIVSAGKIAALLGLEGAASLVGDPARLRGLRDQGVRYLSLTWNETNEFAQGAAGEAPMGLTLKGRDLVARAAREGILVDVSHASPATFWDILGTSPGPVFASHVDAASLAPHRRNLDDIQLWALAETGGVVGLTFFTGFVAPRARRASLEDLLEHFDHVRALLGAEFVSMGSDYDGATSVVEGLDDVSRLPAITAGLLARGWTPDEARGALGGNVLRMFDAADGGPRPAALSWRPLPVHRTAASGGADQAARAVDRDSRTACLPDPALPPVGQSFTAFTRDRPTGVAVAASGPNRPGGVRALDVTVACVGQPAGPAARLDLTGRVRLHGVPLSAPERCKEYEVVLRIAAYDAVGGDPGLAEVVIRGSPRRAGVRPAAGRPAGDGIPTAAVASPSPR